MANIHETTNRDIHSVNALLRYFDPVAGKLYAWLFFKRHDGTSRVSVSLKELAKKLHTRQANISRAKRILRAFRLIEEESVGRYGRTRYTVRPYCASYLRTIYDDNGRNHPLALKAIYVHLKLRQVDLRDEY